MNFFFVPIDMMYMYLLLWYFFIVKNYQKWVYIGMKGVFFKSKSCPKAQQNTLLKTDDPEEDPGH